MVMYMCRYEFYPNTDKMDLDDFVNPVVWEYVRCSRWNGQLLEPSVTVRKGLVTVYCQIPERSSFQRKWLSAYGEAALKEVKRLSHKAPKVEVLGRVHECDGICKCKRPVAYVLQTHLFLTEPPIRCLSCESRVPLYRYPWKTGNDSHEKVLSWEADYKAVDELWLSSGFGERFGHKHMSSLDSPLTKEGRSLCRKLEKTSKVPVFYDLHRWGKRAQSSCPSCGRNWELGYEELGRYNYACRKCRLVAYQEG